MLVPLRGSHNPALHHVASSSKLLCVGGSIGRLHVSAVYFNSDSAPLEVKFECYVPPNCNGTLSNLEIDFEDGTTIKAVVEEKEKAQNIYDDSIARGHSAFLGTKASDKSNCFTLNIGSMLAKSQIKLSFDLDVELQQTLDVSNNISTTTVPVPNFLYAQLNTRRYEVGASIIGGDLSHGWEFTGTFENQTEIHHISLESARGSSFEHIWKTEYLGNSFSLRSTAGQFPSGDAGLFLKIQSKLCDNVQAFVEQSSNIEGEYNALVMFSPRVPKAEAEEFVFLVDRSGSMSGQIADVRASLQLFLRSIPSSCFFNVYGFGSDFNSIFQESLPYNDETLRLATTYAANVRADMGGTNILDPLGDVLLKSSGKSRCVILLTDGEVDNWRNVKKLIEDHSANTRIFTVGIGSGANHRQLLEMASLGKGVAEFVTGSDRVQPVVVRQIKNSSQGYAKNVKLDVALGFEVISSQDDGKLVFASDVRKFYVRGSGSLKDLLEHATISYNHSDAQTKIKVVKVHTVGRSNLIATLATLSQIQVASAKLSTLNAQQQKQTKNDIIKLSTSYGVLSSLTALVAVKQRSEAITESTKFVEIKDKPAPEKSSLFSKAKASRNDPIATLRQALSQLEQRSNFLQTKIDKELEQAKKLATAGDKKGALLSVKKKKLLEQQAQQIMAAQLNIEQQLMSLESATLNVDVLQSMQTGANAMRTVVGSLSVDHVDDILDDIRDQMDIASEINSAISASISDPVLDEDDLLAELESLEQDTLDASASVLAPTALTSAVATSYKPPQPIQQDEDDELEALAREMNIEMPKATGRVLYPVGAQIAQKETAGVTFKLPTSPQGKFEQLVILQKANGSWACCEDVAALLGVPLKTLQSAPDKISEVIWTTIWVMVVLAQKYKQFQVEWELLYAKAESYVCSQLIATGLTLSDLITRVEGLMAK